MNQTELAKHLTSDRYPEADCLKLLKKGQGARAAEWLRAHDPEKARDLAVRVLELGKRATEMAVLGRQGTGLLEVPYRTYELLLGAVPKERKALARPLVEWLELGRDEHLDTLRSRYNDVPLRIRGQALSMNPAYLPRLWALIQPSLGDSLQEQVAAILETDHWTLMTNAAFHLAAAHDIELSSLGARFIQGGRSDVKAHAVKPLLELLWKKDPAAFFHQLESVTKRVGLVSWQVPWMLDFLEPDIQMVEAGEERTVALHADRLVAVVAGTFKKKGRLTLKVHKTAAAAAKDFDKRLVAAEGKLGTTRTGWDGLAAPSVREAFAKSTAEAVLEAVKSGRVDDLEGLLKRGADPNGTVTDNRGRAIAPLVLARSPGVVQRLVEAGSRTSLDDALPNLLQQNYSDGDWPYLCQEASIGLIRAGADTGATKEGWTALHFAASFGWLDVIDALLEAGADPKALAGPEAKVPGQTPVDVAEDEGRHLAAKRLGA